MKTITVLKSKLVTILTDNKKIHIAEYETALETWHVDVVCALMLLHDKAKNTAIGDPIELSVNLRRPTSHIDSYDTALLMCEWENAQEIELSSDEFTKYIQDDWNWTTGFKALNSSYSS